MTPFAKILKISLFVFSRERDFCYAPYEKERKKRDLFNGFFFTKMDISSITNYGYLFRFTRSQQQQQQKQQQQPITRGIAYYAPH